VRLASAARMIAPIVVTLPGLLRMRLRLALTQDQLATKAGIQRPTVNRLEHGKEARITTVRRLADALGCSPEDLMKEQS
jgi:transcriptional regulator with XRE-family HTH domain